jgi:hypothetical protein
MKFEYAIVEWIWDAEALRVNLPPNVERKSTGSYADLVNLLTELGRDGWEVVASASEANWIFYTLKRQV